MNNVCANAETAMYCYFAVIRLVNFFRSLNAQLYYSHYKSSTATISSNVVESGNIVLTAVCYLPRKYDAIDQQ